MRSGDGTIIFPDGSKYIGEWENDKMHGKGQFIRENGKSKD